MPTLSQFDRSEWKHNSQMTKFSERIWSTRAATNHLPGFVSTMQQPGGQSGQRPGGGVNGVTTNEMKIYVIVKLFV